MLSRLRKMLVALLVLGVVVAVPAGAFAAVFGSVCAPAAQAADCCNGGSANNECMAVCAVSAAPVVSFAALPAAAEARTDTALPFASSAYALLQRAPDAAPPKTLPL
jgi:hypothetical protein